MQLSKYFTLAEMCRTTHRKHQAGNVPHDHLLQAGRDLCATILDPIRGHFGKPLIVHSGYRSGALNTAIGGSKSSQHCKFEAADFHVSGVDLRKVFDWIRLESGIKFGQLILEGWSVGQPTWIHVSLGAPYRPESKCGQVLIFEAGEYKRV